MSKLVRTVGAGATAVRAARPGAPIASDPAVAAMPKRVNEPVRGLSGFPLFAGVNEATLARIERACRRRRYAAGETVLERNESSRDTFFIVEGSVRVVTDGAQDRDVTFADMGAGAYFGELAAIDGLPRTATVRVVEDATLVAMPHDTFVNLLNENGLVAFRLLQRLTQVIRHCDDRITALATLNAAQRVYAELLRLAVPDAAVAGLWIVRPCPTEREIASRTGATRETVDRAIRQLRQAGVVRRKGQNLYLLDRAQLEIMARGTDRRGR